jgi:hypothetical protein
LLQIVEMVEQEPQIAKEPVEFTDRDNLELALTGVG